uniref:Uncharacterized protein n=1 Tax=Aegilops tauschii subsp. strangulata TaxID=200361 RepID=A0A453S6R4_AEGTS
MILAYGSVKWWGIFTSDQCSGINRFVALFAVPLLSFHHVAPSPCRCTPRSSTTPRPSNLTNTSRTGAGRAVTAEAAVRPPRGAAQGGAVRVRRRRGRGGRGRAWPGMVHHGQQQPRRVGQVRDEEESVDVLWSRRARSGSGRRGAPRGGAGRRPRQPAV